MKKVVRLTESDLENIVRRVIKEQKMVDVPGPPAPKSSQEFKFGELFPSAQFKITDTANLKQQIENIKQFFKKFPENQQFNLIVKAGESKVPNPKEFEDEGSLAKARANELNKILQSELDGVVNFKLQEPSITIGSTEWDPKKGKDHPDYTKEQFVNLLVNVAGEGPKPQRKIVPYPLFAGTIEPYPASGDRFLYIGFVDGQTFALDWGKNPQQLEWLEYIRKKLGKVVFDQFVGRRKELWRICGGHMGKPTSTQEDVWCYKVSVPEVKDMIQVNNQETADQLIQKIKSERLEFPTTETGKEIRVHGQSQPRHYGE